MVLNCVAYGCNNLHDKRRTISFHTFPFKRPEILKKWVQAIRRKYWSPSSTSRLCGAHFLPSDYQQKPGCTAKILRPDAVPSIFAFSSHLKNNKPTLPRGKIKNQYIECPDCKKVEIGIQTELNKESSVETFQQSEVKRRKSNVGKVQRKNIDSFTVNSLKRKLRILQIKLMQRDKMIKMLNSFIMSDKKRRQLCTCQSY